MNGGIVHWDSCGTQEEAFNAAGTAGDFECRYSEFQQFAWNLIGLIAITLWSGCICALMFFLLNLFKLLRYVS